MLSCCTHPVEAPSLPFVHMPTHQVGTPVPTISRQGRQNQRYGENGERLVAGCIPVRIVGDGPDGVRVLLVSSRNPDSSGWVFPKGGWELDETTEVAARRETVEESGVRGALVEPMLGVFRFQNRKASPGNKGCVAYMYVLHVEEELAEWPEQGERIRAWFTLNEASAKCRHGWMRQALHQWIREQGWTALADQLDAEAEGLVNDSSCRSLSS